MPKKSSMKAKTIYGRLPVPEKPSVKATMRATMEAKGIYICRVSQFSDTVELKRSFILVSDNKPEDADDLIGHYRDLGWRNTASEAISVFIACLEEKKENYTKAAMISRRVYELLRGDSLVEEVAQQHQKHASLTQKRKAKTDALLVQAHAMLKEAEEEDGIHRD